MLVLCSGVLFSKCALKLAHLSCQLMSFHKGAPNWLRAQPSATYSKVLSCQQLIQRKDRQHRRKPQFAYVILVQALEKQRTENKPWSSKWPKAKVTHKRVCVENNGTENKPSETCHGWIHLFFVCGRCSLGASKFHATFGLEAGCPSPGRPKTHLFASALLNVSAGISASLQGVVSSVHVRFMVRFGLNFDPFASIVGSCPDKVVSPGRTQPKIERETYPRLSQTGVGSNSILNNT